MQWLILALIAAAPASATFSAPATSFSTHLLLCLSLLSYLSLLCYIHEHITSYTFIYIYVGIRFRRVITENSIFWL